MTFTDTYLQILVDTQLTHGLDYRVALVLQINGPLDPRDKEDWSWLVVETKTTERSLRNSLKRLKKVDLIVWTDDNLRAASPSWGSLK